MGRLEVCQFYYCILIGLCVIQCPPLNRITLGQHKIDNINRMIQLTDVFCELFRCEMGPVISDYNTRLILLSVIQLSGGHCNLISCKILFQRLK